MKFSILVNVKAWSENFPEANFNHIAIYDVIHGLCTATNKKLVRKNGYTWISSNHISNEIPPLHIETTGGLTKYISKLKEFGLIDTFQDKDRKQYYKITEKSELLIRDDLKDEKDLLTNVSSLLTNVSSTYLQTQADHITINPITNNHINNTTVKKSKQVNKKQDSFLSPNGDGKNLTTRLHDFFLEKQGESYIPNFPKERKIILNLIKRFKTEDEAENKIKQHLENYFNSKTQFLENLGHGLEYFVNNFNAFNKIQKNGYEPVKPVNAPSYQYSQERIDAVEAQFNKF